MPDLANPDKQLQPPPAAFENAESLEILRAWTDPQGDMQVSLRVAWEDPAAFGVMLVDIAHHAAKAYQQQGKDPEEVLSRIRTLFEAEWASRTDTVHQIDGEPQDFEETQRQADAGDTHCQVLVGMSHVEKGDEQEALRWFQKSADAGYAVGQYNLAEMYRDGTGVEKDAKKALEYYELAAKQGYPPGLYNAGIMHATGEGTDENLVAAYFWLSHAAESGIDGGEQAKELIKSNMSPEQVEAAEALIRGD